MDWELYFVQGFELLFLGIGSYFDIKNRELPIEFLISFGILGLFCNWIWKYQSIAELALGLSIGLFFLMIARLSKEAIGYGDGIGLCVLGILEGFEGMIPVIFGAFLLCSVYGVWRLIGFKESPENSMPFFPFLFAALIGVILL